MVKKPSEIIKEKVRKKTELRDSERLKEIGKGYISKPMNQELYDFIEAILEYFDESKKK